MLPLNEKEGRRQNWARYNCRRSEGNVTDNFKDVMRLEI